MFAVSYVLWIRSLEKYTPRRKALQLPTKEYVKFFNLKFYQKLNNLLQHTVVIKGPAVILSGPNIRMALSHHMDELIFTCARETFQICNCIFSASLSLSTVYMLIHTSLLWNKEKYKLGELFYICKRKGHKKTMWKDRKLYLYVYKYFLSYIYISSEVTFQFVVGRR